MREWERFNLGFWHPFGPHTGLTETEIVSWKHGETQQFGWTFWSLVYSPTAHFWLHALSDVKGPVFVLCSRSPSARDPDVHRGQLLATHYQWPREGEWNEMPIPDQMKVTNPFKRRGLALAFRVRRVIEIAPTVAPFKIEWYSKKDQMWRSDRLPTRGEFLVRRGGSAYLRRVRAILELDPLYLATLLDVS
jgi:hypothetical protein